MFRRLWRKFVALLLLLLGGCSYGASLPEGPFQFSLVREVDVSIPPGDQVYQDDDRVLFLSSYTLEHPPTTVVAFSLSQQQEEWRVDLPAAPVQALRTGSLYLIATIPSESSGEAYVGAVSMSGDLMWVRPWGKTMTAVGSDGERIWVAWEQGIAQIDPETGDPLRSVAVWERASSYGSHRAIASYRSGDQTYLIAAAGRMVFLYREQKDGWESVWSFGSAGRVLEMHPIPTAGDPAWLVLAHSYAYGIGGDGQVLWRVENSDYNLDGQMVRCAGENVWAFRNVMSGLYLVDARGVIRSWRLPGGYAHAGPLPLPFPKHLAFGLRGADLNGDGEDELFVRSADSLLVFDCQGNLLAFTSVDSSDEKIVTRLRRSRLHQPVIFGQEIVVPGENGVLYLTLQPR